MNEEDQAARAAEEWRAYWRSQARGSSQSWLGQEEAMKEIARWDIERQAVAHNEVDTALESSPPDLPEST